MFPIISFTLLTNSPLQILYKPVKDLSGIPGSQSLIICLTGYQRRERDDIMVWISRILFKKYLMPRYQLLGSNFQSNNVDTTRIQGFRC